eukprot:5313578-Prymnesium_polylepis.1
MYGRSARHHAARRRPIRTRLALPPPAPPARAAAARPSGSESDQMSVYSTRVTLDCDEMSLEYPTSPCSSASSNILRESPPPRSAGSSAGCTPPSLSSCASCGPELEDCADGLCELRGR